MSDEAAMIGTTLSWREEDGRQLSVLRWEAPAPLRAVSTALVGGGIGPMGWFLNAQVHPDYHRHDPATHVRELAETAGLHGPGVGMLTAVDVATVERSTEDGVGVLATVGLGWPTWAAAPAPTADATSTPTVGTINLLVVLPRWVHDAALVNLATTATEAKVQALLEAGVAGTGTASDALCVACPLPDHVDPDEPGGPRSDGSELFGGPRSYWGARVARAVHRAVRAGAAADWDRAVANGWPRPPRQGG